MTPTAEPRDHAWFRWPLLFLFVLLAAFYAHRVITEPDATARHQALIEGLTFHFPLLGAAVVVMVFWRRILKMRTPRRILVGGALLAFPIVADLVAYGLLGWRDELRSLRTLLVFVALLFSFWAVERLVGLLRDSPSSHATG